MPELPEVQTVVVTLRPRIAGGTIVGVRLVRQDVLEPAGVDLPARLEGRKIQSIDRRGKRIIFTLDDSNQFFIHLGMTGRLTINHPGDSIPAHTHLFVDFAPPTDSVSPNTTVSSQLRFSDPRRFGGIWWLGTEPCDAGMGPEPLSVRPKQLAALLARTSRAVKSALLDQSVLAGLGNIYVDEALYAAGIHPLTTADRLTIAQISKLNRAIKAVLRRALRHRGSTLRDYRDANGNAGDFQLLHRVYAREQQPCHNCKTPIERIVLGGRSTHFCPTCQRNG